ncbi:Rha family transcriptional regulator [Photobacterium sp. R1]
MENLIKAPVANELTMSSREIADLVESRHDSVKRTIERLSERGIISITPLVEPQKRGGKPVTSYHVNKRDSYVVVAQLSPEFTARLVDRWQVLEAKNIPVLPTRTELALMVIEAEKEREAANKEVHRLQGVCNTMAAQFAFGMTAPKFCKQLNGVNTQQVNRKLVELGMLRNEHGGFVPTAYSRDQYFAEKQIEKNGGIRSSAVLTLKGAKWLYRAYLSNKLPMKSNWDGKCSHIIFEDEEMKAA